MTDPFSTFVHQRKLGSLQEKTARPLAGFMSAASEMASPLGDLLKKLITREKPTDITQQVMQGLGRPAQQLGIPGTGAPPTPQEMLEYAQMMHPKGTSRLTQRGDDLGVELVEDVFSPGRAATSAGVGLGLGGVMGMMEPSAETAAYKVQQMLFPAHERVEAEDAAVKSFASTSGSNLANMLDELLRTTVGGAVSAAGDAALSFSQSAMFEKAMEGDLMLRDASPADKDMLRRAFASMVRFAPRVATDEFAVKNYLREAMIAANGPDYATLGNLARVNLSLTGA